MIRAVIPLVLIALGGGALLGAAITLRSLGPGVRIGRLLATAPRVSVAEAVRIATAGETRVVAIEGRIESDEPFEDVHQRPLVLRRTRIEALTARGWQRFEDGLEAVPFEIRDGLDGIGVDTAALDAGLVVMPRESRGLVRDLDDRAPAGLPADAPARATIDLVSSVEHGTVIGQPALDAQGRPTMTAGGGRPLILSTLDGDEAMRVLAGGDRLRPRLAAVLLVGGGFLVALGLAWAGLQLLGLGAPAAVLAADPNTIATPAPTGLGGDTRSSGTGPGLVGAPGPAILAVVLIALAAVGATLLYVRLTGGRRAR
jgi:hypothetical protein